MTISNVCKALSFSAIALASTTARAEGAVDAVPSPPPQLGSVTGVTIEARLPRVVAPVGLGNVSNVALADSIAGPPPVAIGYRGNGFSLVIGPSIGHVAADSASSSCDANGACTSGTTTSSTSFFGATVLAEIDLVHSRDKRAEGYLMLGGNLAIASESSGSSSSSSAPSSSNDGLNGKPAFGFIGGVGLRYWVAPSLGVGAELGEDYLNLPLGATSSSSSSGGTSTSNTTTSLRGSIISTFGSISVSLAFGG